MASRLRICSVPTPGRTEENDTTHHAHAWLSPLFAQARRRCGLREISRGGEARRASAGLKARTILRSQRSLRIPPSRWDAAPLHRRPGGPGALARRASPAASDWSEAARDEAAGPSARLPAWWEVFRFRPCAFPGTGDSRRAGEPRHPSQPRTWRARGPR